MLALGDRRLTLRVGSIVLVVVALAVAFELFLSSKLEVGAAVRIKVYFHHVGALQPGASLMVAGHEVGKIDGIVMVPAGPSRASDPLHGAGGAMALVRVDASSAWMVPINSVLFVSSRGFLSERYLEVAPPDGGAPGERPVRNGDALRGIDPPSLDDVFVRTWANLERSRVFLEAVRPEWDKLVAEIDALEATLREAEPAPGAYAALGLQVRATAAQAGLAWAKVQASGVDADALAALAAQVRATLEAFEAASARLSARLDAIQAGLERVGQQVDRASPELVAKLRKAVDGAEAALAKVDALVASARDLVGRFERGEGTLARISRDPEFPEEAKDLGKIMKRRPWRLIFHLGDEPRSAPPPPPSGKAPTRQR